MGKNGFSDHTSRQLNETLEGIHERVMAMGGLVEQQLGDALAALISGDMDAAERLQATGETINAMDVELDNRCVTILARRQPAASDLRLVIAVIKAVADLERIGDEAERIGRMALRADQASAYKDLLAGLHELGSGVRASLRDALDSLARLDAEQAVAMVRRDVITDRRYAKLLSRIMERMREEPEAVRELMKLMWAARSLERIGDRCCNLCEHVIYLVKGKTVRHTSPEQLGIRAGVEQG
ncbi:MAG: phosphate signaling complex protein PhoU [Xanthomonadaceae bacterium]|nr:phosphate signaling complex protein PhoU [Xanthomonadaceae bacterium]